MSVANVTNPSSTLNDLEIEKRKLEIEKIKIETAKLETEQKELNKPWYAKPQWWSVLVPFIIGTGTILIAFLTGIISVERLKNEKNDLAKTIKLQKDSIIYFSNYVQTQKDSLIELVKLEQSNIRRLQFLSDSLKIANKSQNELIKLSNKEKLDRINNEIYMYEDHDSLYRQLDEVLGDSTLKYEREKKLEELRKARNAIKRQLKLSPKS